MQRFLLAPAILVILMQTAYATPVTGINPVSKHGQVFVTWTNLTSTGVKYVLYKSAHPIIHGYQLDTAQNLGYVHDSSSLNKRLSNILGVRTYL